MQDINKTNFKKGLVEMLEPISKHSIIKNIQNNNPLKSYKEKNKHLIMIQMTTILTIISLIIGMKNSNQLKMMRIFFSIQMDG
jgi:hypothetical protein